MPHQFTTLAEHLKTKYRVFFFLSQKREKTYVITLEVYNVKALEVYNVKALEVYNVKALEVYNVKALEVYNIKALEVYNIKTLGVFIYLLFTGGVHLCIM